MLLFTIHYYHHHSLLSSSLGFLKDHESTHPVSKMISKGFAGEIEVQKKWEEILVSSSGWVVSPAIYTRFLDASDAYRVPGGSPDF